MKPKDIAICGAGIGGLAAASLLARQGHAVTIVERFETPRPLGAGLMLQPTGLAALDYLGCRAAVEGLGHRIDRIEGHTSSGRTIFDLAYRDLDPAISSLGIHRAALFSVLRKTTMSSSIRWLTNTTIASTVLAKDRRTLTDTSGRTVLDADLVIDATGTNSVLREANASVQLNRPYPYGAVWAALPMPSTWPKQHRLSQVYDQAKIMIGILPIGTLPGDTTERVAFFWSVKSNKIEAWQRGDLDTWKAQVRKLWPAADPFLNHIRATTDLNPARYADIWIKRPYTDRLVLIGDAARSASPQLGQGANLALIDAVVLSHTLTEHPKLSDALTAYASHRRAHTRFYGVASRLLTPFFQSDSRLASGIRDAAFAPLARVPYIRREMVRTLAGLKTGILQHETPATLLRAK